MSQQKFTLESERVVSKVFAGDAIVIHLETGFYYGMEETATPVWELISGGTPISDIVDALKAQYPAADIGEQAVQIFVDELVQARLIKPVDGDDASSQNGETQWPDAYQPLVLTCYDDVAEMVALDPPLPELDYGKEG